MSHENSANGHNKPTQAEIEADRERHLGRENGDPN